MAVPAVADLVHQTSTSTGTGNLTLAAVNGKRTFAVPFSTGGTTNVFHYFISSRDAAEWEYGTGHMSDSTTLVRDTVIKSSNSDAAVSFSAGTKDVTNDMPAAAQGLMVRADISTQALTSPQKVNAQTNMGVRPGTEVQAFDAQLASVMTLNGKTASYTLALTDGGGMVRVTGTTASQTITIPANGSVAFPIGTVVTIPNDSTQNWSIAITTDTLKWPPAGTTGTRTLAANGLCTLLKVDTAEWKISGVGLT